MKHLLLVLLALLPSCASNPPVVYCGPNPIYTGPAPEKTNVSGKKEVAAAQAKEKKESSDPESDAIRCNQGAK